MLVSRMTAEVFIADRIERAEKTASNLVELAVRSEKEAERYRADAAENRAFAEELRALKP